MSDRTIAVFQEIGSGSNGQRSDEDDFVKVDDLPLQLTVMCEVCASPSTGTFCDRGVDGLSCVARRSFRRG